MPPPSKDTEKDPEKDPLKRMLQANPTLIFLSKVPCKSKIATNFAILSIR